MTELCIYASKQNIGGKSKLLSEPVPALTVFESASFQEVQMHVSLVLESSYDYTYIIRASCLFSFKGSLPETA